MSTYTCVYIYIPISINTISIDHNEFFMVSWDGRTVGCKNLMNARRTVASQASFSMAGGVSWHMAGVSPSIMGIFNGIYWIV